MNGVRISELPADDALSGSEQVLLCDGPTTKRASTQKFIDKVLESVDDGASAYEVAVANGFVGTEEEWLASLVGETGATGDQGVQGIQGEKGDPGDATAEDITSAISTHAGLTDGTAHADSGIADPAEYDASEDVAAGEWADAYSTARRLVQIDLGASGDIEITEITGMPVGARQLINVTTSDSGGINLTLPVTCIPHTNSVALTEAGTLRIIIAATESGHTAIYYPEPTA